MVNSARPAWINNCLSSSWNLSRYNSQISILFCNFACCTRRFAADEERYASHCLAWRIRVCLKATQHAILKQRGLFLISTQRDLF